MRDFLVALPWAKKRESKLAKVVFISGASRGIGRATALAFAKAGYHVAISARELDNHVERKNKVSDSSYAEGSLQETALMIKNGGGEVLAVKMDLLDHDSVARAVNDVLSYFGHIDVLINNAIYQGPDLNLPLMSLSRQTLENVAKAYITSPVQIVQSVLPNMMEYQGGCIINITSGAGETDPPIEAAKGGWGYGYGAGKAAVSRLAGVINREHGRDGIRAFTLNPGVVNTETLRATIGDKGIQNLKQSIAEPSQIASVILWIAEEEKTEHLLYRTINAQSVLVEKIKDQS